MQNVDGLVELGGVHHAVSAACLPDPNLPRARTYLVEGSPVVWPKPGLNLPPLKTRFLPGIFWECQEIVVGRPYPTDLLFIVHTTGMYKLLYARAGAGQGARRTMTSGARAALSTGNPVLGSHILVARESASSHWTRFELLRLSTANPWGFFQRVRPLGSGRADERPSQVRAPCAFRAKAGGFVRKRSPPEGSTVGDEANARDGSTAVANELHNWNRWYSKCTLSMECRP
jgi:hypothetical protein